MTKRESGPTESEKKQTKRLYKREKRLVDRVEEAQERYEAAQERLRRAEDRVAKTKSRVERLEGRLLLARQQLHGPVGSEVVSMEEAKVEQERVSLEATGSVAEEMARQEEEAEEEGNTVQEELGGERHLEEVSSENEGKMVAQVPPEEEKRPEIETSEERNEPEIVEKEREEEPVQGDAFEEENEDREPLLVEDEEPLAEPMMLEELVIEPVLVEELIAEPVSREEEPSGDSGLNDEIAKVLYEARELAETAERVARVAMRRTDHVFDHLERMLKGRSFQPELERLQDETETLSALARRARRIVEAVIALSAKAEPGEELAFWVREVEEQRQMLGLVRTSFEVDIQEEQEEENRPVVTAESALDMGVEEIVFDLPESVFSHSGESGEGESEEVKREVPPFPLEVIEAGVNVHAREAGQIAQLNEEEKEVEIVAAMLIANAAAAAAAEAEALAEASGQNTREAYAAAVQADQTVKQIRAAIQFGTLRGEEAETMLQQVERGATEAQAALADAEAAEEQAVSAAINAEAEAEVAEGMALSAHERGEDGEEEEERIPQAGEHLVIRNETLKRAQVEADEAEIQKSVSSQQEFA